jgi:endonuclease YncB( thermonuclease family)
MNAIIKISFTVLLIPAFALASNTLHVERVISVYDGDTFRVDINGLHPLIGKNIGIRVAGVDTPEIRGKCDREKVLAQQAKLMTSQFVKRNTGSVELRNPSRGKYFRIVADVWANGQSLKRKLLDAKLAYPYNGGKKQSWCDR